MIKEPTEHSDCVQVEKNLWILVFENIHFACRNLTAFSLSSLRVSLTCNFFPWKHHLTSLFSTAVEMCNENLNKLYRCCTVYIRWCAVKFARPNKNWHSWNIQCFLVSCDFCTKVMFCFPENKDCQLEVTQMFSILLLWCIERLSDSVSGKLMFESSKNPMFKSATQGITWFSHLAISRPFLDYCYILAKWEEVEQSVRTLKVK